MKTLRPDRLGWLAAGVLATLVLVGVLGPLLPIGDASAIGAGPRLAGPSAAFWLGTDDLGRDVLPRVVDGIRSTLGLSAASVLITALLGTLLGMAAGTLGGLADGLVARCADVLLAFPALLLGLLAAAIVGPGELPAIVVICATTLPLFVRVVRSVTLTVARRDFVVAARVAGASTGRVLWVHVLPSVRGAVVVQLSHALAVGMLVESGLSFLGLGVQPPQATLGSLLRVGSVYLNIAPALVLAPGLVLALAITAVNLLGDALRDRLEPLHGRPLR